MVVGSPSKELQVVILGEKAVTIQFLDSIAMAMAMATEK